MAEPKKPAGKKPAAKKPAAKKRAPKKAAPKKKPAPKPVEPKLEDDFLDDLDAELDEVISAPTQEHPAPEGAIEDVATEDRAAVPAGDLDDEEPDEEPEQEGTEETEQPTRIVAATAAAPPAARPPVAKAGNGFGRPRRRFPMWARFIAASFVIIASVAAATSASLILYLSDIADALGHNKDLIGAENLLSGIHGSGPETILIVGSDHREGQGAGHGLSDTTMLLRVDPDRKAIALMSIPRDLEVTIPGYGVDKFNAAYSLGGPKLTLQTVQQLTGMGENGLPGINHIVNVDFIGFAKAVSAIGCVYVDVDRRYYHSNQGLSAAAQYSEIDVRPGYQRLCGYNALEYVRYRHTDNDIVRNARQQDFLREARARVPATDLLTNHHDLIKIFTHYTSSDINDPQTALEVIKLFIAARNDPVKEIHFPGSIGAKVTVTPGQMEQAVSQFLGIEGTKGPRGSSATPAGGGPTPVPETPKTGKSKKKTGPEPAAPAPKKGSDLAALGLEKGTFGKKLAYRVQRRNHKMPVYYPAVIASGSEYAQRPRAYTLADPALQNDERFAYRFTLNTPSGDYYGLQGLRWKDPPILSEPHETKKVGDRTFNLYYDNDRLRLVSWETDDAVYWVSNSLLETLSADQMLAIAKGAKLLPAVPGA